MNTATSTNGQTIAVTSQLELQAAIAAFKQQINPFKQRRPNTGYRMFTINSHTVQIDINEAQRGWNFHARAVLSLNGTRATWPAIAKVLTA
jgi:hypothetical protein